MGIVTVTVGPPLMFYSQRDEAHFFAWLDSIAGVVGRSGRGRCLDLEVDVESLGVQGFRELIAVFRRYGHDVTALRALDEERTIPWLSGDRTKSWSRSVFGEPDGD